MNDIIPVIIYSLLWLITFLIYIYKRKTFDIGAFVIFLFLLCSISSVLLYNIDMGHTYYNITIVPFIYLFLVYLLTIIPILQFNQKQIINYKIPNIKLLNIIAIIYILTELTNLPNLITNFSQALVLLLFTDGAAYDMYQETRELYDSAGSGITNVPAIIAGALSPIGILLTFLFITIRNSNKFIKWGLFLSCIIRTLISVSLGQRNSLVETTLIMISTFFLLREFMPSNIVSRIKRIGIVSLIGIFSLFLLMTISRFGDEDSSAINSIYSYAGQSSLNFNMYAFDNNGIRYGDRTVPFFKRLLGFENVPSNFMERRAKYPNLFINDEVFIGYVGDFLLDFGPIVGSIILMFLFFYLIQRAKIRRRNLYFHQLIIIHFCLYMCIIGTIKLFPFSDVHGNLKWISYILVYLIFIIKYPKSKIKRVIN